MAQPETPAELIVQKARTDPRIRQAAEDVMMFDQLRDHAGFRRLLRIMDSEEEYYFSKLARKIVRNFDGLDQREIDYQRGFLAGARWILSLPEEAEKKLESAAQVAFASLQEEQLSEEEELKPYE